MIAGSSVAGSSSTPDVRGHDRPHAGGDRGAKRRQPVLDVADERRQLEMRVLLGRAVAGEVLRACRHAAALDPAHVGRDVPRDERGVGAERARADHRVRRHVHVCHGREVPVDARVRKLGGDRRGDRLRQRDVVDGAERRAARIRAAGLPLEPRHIAALLVDREQHVARARRAATAHKARSRSRDGTL